MIGVLTSEPETGALYRYEGFGQEVSLITTFWSMAGGIMWYQITFDPTVDRVTLWE